MAADNLITLVVQMQTEIENLAIRGIRSIDREQKLWLKNTRDSLREMGAEFLASRMSHLLDEVESGTPSKKAAAHLLDLLTTVRVFNRVLTLDLAKSQIVQLIDAPEGAAS